MSLLESKLLFQSFCALLSTSSWKWRLFATRNSMVSDVPGRSSLIDAGQRHIWPTHNQAPVHHGLSTMHYRGLSPYALPRTDSSVQKRKSKLAPKSIFHCSHSSCSCRGRLGRIAAEWRMKHHHQQHSLNHFNSRTCVMKHTC